MGHQRMSETWALASLFLLGCYHGINPGMGWLFAVALGLQERATRAIFQAVVPIAIGHVASITIVVAIAVFAAVSVPHAVLHRVAGIVLLSFGAYRLIRVRHPRWVGMHVGFWGLVFWGFLMSSAHGAGLMLVPFVTASPEISYDHSMNMPAMQARHTVVSGLLMLGVHTLGYLTTMLVVALIVYARFGLSFLRSAWFNVDAAWATALFITGVIALVT